jgi:hypothetical protein
MKNTTFIFFLILPVLFSCKKDVHKQTIEQVVNEWTGKTVEFPKEDILCKVMGRDTLAPELFQKPYKILLYVDSTGCTSCKLRMPEWKRIIEEADSIAPGQIGFLFFFNPKSLKELDFLMKRDRFDYPVFVDENNKMDQLNHFPGEMSFQSFLLDRENKVLVIGNPSMNPRVWELYKQQITGNKSREEAARTTVETVQSKIEVQGLQVGKVSSVIFVLKNTGKSPLIIQDVKSSCGCTVPDWDKSPVKPGGESKIRVEIKPEEPGYFHKTIDVYCNVADYKLQMTVTGNVK